MVNRVVFFIDGETGYSFSLPSRILPLSFRLRLIYSFIRKEKC